MHSTIDFGKKHPGKLVKDVIRKDPEFIEWCHSELPWFKLDMLAKTELQHALDMADRTDQSYEGWLDYNSVR
jgi:hypothetical protein